MALPYKKFKRIFVIVADSMGIGEADDAKKFDDEGSNTFGHIAEKMTEFKVPTLQKLGIGNLTLIDKVAPNHNQIGFAARLKEISNGKDTLTGHFEMMGLEVTNPYPSFTDTGFPAELIKMLEDYSHRKVVGNISASGTEIIKELGEHQMATGDLIVYTSSDSVLQIAAHEKIIPLEELYDICKYARKITIENPSWQVGRIIARPFVGEDKDHFIRTTNRHDYSVKPFAKTVLDTLKDSGYYTYAVGKINDIFDGEGITDFERITSNNDGMVKTTNMLDYDFTGLVFTNLVDFDALYGHRRDPIGYGKAIEELDRDLANFIDKMGEEDLLIVTADHGNDPTFKGTDHTREYVPLLCYYKGMFGKTMDIQTSFACIGCTITENFKVQSPTIGHSLLDDITRHNLKKDVEYLEYHDQEIYTAKYYNDKSDPSKMVQIFHGMAEHSSRYEDFIEKLVNDGYTVIIHDHIAHGLSCKKNKIGVIEEEDFMTAILNVCKLVHDHYFKNAKVSYLLGHSMGSMTAFRYIELYPDDFSKTILSGCDIYSIKYGLMKTIAKAMVKKYGPISYTKLIRNLTNGAFNAKFKNEESDVAWLSENILNVKAYEDCELCGTEFPSNYYESLSQLLKDTKANLDAINKTNKIFIISGNLDPVTANTKSSYQILKVLQKQGIDASVKIYKGRHELFHEDYQIAFKVMEDLIDFFDNPNA